MSITTAADLADQTTSYISGMHTQAQQEINRLDSFADSWAVSTVSAPTGIDSAITLTDTYPTLEADITLNAIQAIHVAQTDIDSYIQWIDAPTLISAPSVISYNTPKWSETYWTHLKDGIDAFINNITGTDDIDSVITKLTSDTDKLQVAFYAQDLERKQQVLRDLYSAANSGVANKGFLYPNSMTTALKLDAQQKFQFDLSQTSRDLIKFLFEWAKSNWQFTVDKGISAHNSDVDFNMRYCDVLIKAYSSEANNQIELFKAEVSQELTKVKERLDKFNAQIDAIVKHYTAYTSGQLDIYKTVSDGDRNKIAKFSAEWNAYITAAKSNIDFYQMDRQSKIDAAAKALTGATTIASSAAQLAIGVL